MKPRYVIRGWIPVEAEEEVYKSLEDARRELEHCQFLQPENIYKIECADGEGKDEDEEEGLEGLAEK